MDIPSPTHIVVNTTFNQAMMFLYEQHGHCISEDLVQAYCHKGLLQEDEQGRLTLTDRGRAELRLGRRKPLN
jgi:hypothetical protein